MISEEKNGIEQNVTEMVSCIMDPTPEQWGLLGDPFFWEELRQHFDKIPMPYDEWHLTLDIYRLFSQVTNGEWLSKAGNRGIGISVCGREEGKLLSLEVTAVAGGK